MTMRCLRFMRAGPAEAGALGCRRVLSAGSVTLKPAPPSSPVTSVMSPPSSSAFFLAIDRPRPMPRFLNVIVGSNSVRARLLAEPGPESCTSTTA